MEKQNSKIIPVVLVCREWVDNCSDQRIEKTPQYKRILKNLKQDMYYAEDKIFPRIDEGVKDNNVVYRIAIESFASQCHEEKETNTIKYKFRFKGNFEDLFVEIYATFFVLNFSNKTVMFFNYNSRSNFDSSVKIGIDADLGLEKISFPSHYQTPVIYVEIDQDSYVSLGTYTFSPAKKLNGIVITEQKLYYAKKPTEINMDSVRTWLPTQYVQFCQSVFKALRSHEMSSKSK